MTKLNFRLTFGVPTFLKWAGGKQRLLKQMFEYFPDEFINFYDPFVGGGSVSLFVANNFKTNIHISDINKDLINLYITIRDGKKEILNYLKELDSSYKDYYKLREEFNKCKNIIYKSAMLIYLNKNCFNGLYRVNRSGLFNTPSNGSITKKFYDIKIINKASNLISSFDIKSCDFANILKNVVSKDFVYLDPPYFKLKDNSFTDYSIDGFNNKDYDRFFKFVEELNKKGVNIMISSCDSEIIREKLKKYNIYEIDSNSMIGSKNNSRKKIKELIITNYGKK